MSFSKNGSSKKRVCVLDFGADIVTCIVGSRKEDDTFQVAGSASGPAKGVAAGEVTHIADATESVLGPFKKACVAAGVRPDAVYYSFDDAQMQTALVSGSKVLSGDGEIDMMDVRQASENALRMAGDFERKTLYFKPLNFTIDDQDVVIDPVGIFGKKLEAQLLILQARSTHFEAWTRIMERAGIEKAVPVLSAWATACGILSRERRREGALVVDLGKDFVNAFEVGNQRIRNYQVFSTVEVDAASGSKKISDFFKDKKNPDELWITGDLSESSEWMSSIEKMTAFTLRRGKPTGVEGLSESRYATLAGLLSVADECEKTPVLHRDRGLLANVKERAASFLSEYF